MERLAQAELIGVGRRLRSTAPIVLARKTAELQVRVKALARSHVAIVVDVDGELYRCESDIEPGPYVDKLGNPRDFGVLGYVLPYGHFDNKPATREEWADMPMRRLGEYAKAPLRAWVEVTGSAEVEFMGEAQDAPRGWHSSVAYQNAGSAFVDSFTQTVSFSFTAGAGSNRAAFIFGAGSRDTRPTGSSITFGGGSPSVALGEVTNTYWRGRGAIVKDAEIGTGAKTVQFATSGGGGTTYHHTVTAVSFTGVDQTTPNGTAVTAGADSGTSLSITVASPASDSMVVDAWSWAQQGNTGTSVGAAQTARVNVNTSIGSGVYAFYNSSTQLGSDGGVMSWTKGNSNYEYVGMAVEMKAASVGPVEVPLDGELSFSGGVARQLSLSRDVAGALTFDGTLESQQSLARALAGELDFAGSVAVPESVPLAGALDFSGEIALKFDAKHLFGELAFQGTAEAAQSLFRDVAGAVGFAGNVDAAAAGVTEIHVDIAANADDVLQIDTGLFPNFTAAGMLFSSEYEAGLRFQSVAVPQSATIVSATLTLNITSVNGSPETTVYGVDVDDAAAWAAPGNLPGNATTTTESSPGPTATGSQQIDVTGIVQEIVGRGGWTSGNDMAFVVLNDKALSGQDHTWFAEDLNDAGGNEARLTIQFSGASVGIGGELGFGGNVVTAQSRGVEGELSFAGAVDAQQSLQRAVAGELGFSGTVGAQALFGASLAGALSFSGAIDAVTYRDVALAGQLAFAGNIAAQQTLARALAGELGFSGALAAQQSLARGLAGNLGFAGELEAAGLSVGLAGELGFAGALDFVRMRGLAGELGLVGTLPQIVTTGTVEIAAVLAESGSIKSTGSYTEARAGTNLSLESGGIVGQTVEDNANAPFPQVSGTPVSSTAAAGSSIDVTMSATVEANDLLLIFVSGGDNNSFDAVSGWTQKTNAFGSPNNANLAIYAKKAVGNEDGTTVTVTGGGTNQKTALVYRILADTWSQDLDDVVVGTPVLDTNTWFADPPNLSPGYTLNTLWFAVGAIQSGSINPFVDSPDNYGTVQSVSSGGSAPGFHRLGVATRELNAASDNPTRFEVNSAVRQDSVAQTLAVRPAKAAVVYQSFLAWDTDGVVPAGNTLTDAVIELDVDTTEGSATYTYDIWQGASAWLPTLATGDFVAGTSLDGGTLAASKARADISAGSYQEWVSEAGIAALINLSGNTEFMLASSRQENGDAPSAAELITFDLVTNPPRLTLTYQSTASLLGGNLGFSGLIAPQQTLARAVSGELGFAGAIEASAVARVLFGEVGFSGDVAAQQFMNRALAGSLDFEGRIAQDQGVFIGGELGFAGDLAAFQAAVRLAGELGFAGSIEALMLDIYLSGELSFNGLVRRSGNASGIKPNIGSAGLWTPRAGSGWYSSPKNGSAGFWKPRPGS